MKAEITCRCSKCKLTLNCPKPSLCLLCGCKDCRQALNWCFRHGGSKPTFLPKLFYVRSDIHSFEGLEFMKPFHLRSKAKSTRVYCTKCFSILGVDHPGYKDNVFMFFEGYCDTTCDLSIKPSAAISLNDLPPEEKLELPEYVEKIWSFNSEESAKFHLIPEVNNSFRKPTGTINGITFKILIKDIYKLVLDKR